MLADQLLKNGHYVKKIEVPHIPIKNFKNPSFAILSTIKSIVNRESYDIVQGFNNPSAYAMKYDNGKKKVLSLHGVFGEQIEKLHSKPISSIAKIAESQVLQWPDKLTTDSKATQKIYKKKFNLDFEVLPSALDTQQFSKIGNIKKIPNQICYIGRDSYEKGIDILKKAEPKINGNVVYCTNRSWVDAMSVMKSSSLVVVPSRMESLPTTVKEAFFLNIPVVATNVGGIPELITHDKNGIIVSPDNPDKLADAINNLLFDKIKSEKLAVNANIFLKNNMTWDVTLPKFIKFYEDLLSD
jgi:glycosyltransferase involved in cell wall biosynthesis